MGEVFITNPAVVPNARRDGFEDSKDWREIKADIRKRVAKRVVTLVRNASKGRSALKTISNEIAALQRSVESGGGDEAALKALIATAEKLRSKLASDKLSGVDPKEVGEFVAKVKGLKEKLVEALNKLRKQESEPAADTEQDDEPEADGGQEGAEGSGADQEEDTDNDEDAEAWSVEQLLDALLEVIAREHGQPEADRLLGLARESLSD